MIKIIKIPPKLAIYRKDYRMENYRYRVVQIIATPNLKSKYAIRNIGKMAYFNFDFMTKNSLKKFFSEEKYESGEYLVLKIQEEEYIPEAICIYRDKEQGFFIDFKLPGEEWKALVREVFSEIPEINVKLEMQTMHKVSVPVI